MNAGQPRPKAERRFKRVGGALASVLALTIAGVALSAGSGAAAPPGSADLSITKSDAPDPVQVGGPLTYTLTVQNAGPSDATGVVVTDKLPNDVTFLSATSTNGNCTQQNHIVTCNIGALGTTGGAATAEVTITVRPTQAGDLTNTASVKSDQQDTNQQNNHASATTTVTAQPPAGPTCHGHVATFVGTPGDDTIVLGGERDVVVSRGGDDRIATDGGRDIVCAGGGNDIVTTGGRRDFVKGGRGADKIRGGNAADKLHGNRGPDRLRGGRGDDLLAGGRGDDTCKGGPGDDTKRSC